jgi:hypothetical protein
MRRILKKGIRKNPVINQRNYSRRPTYIVAEYYVHEGTFRDVIKNLGPGGVFVKTDRKIGVGQTITLKFPLFDFDDEIEVAGKIIRAQPGGFTVGFYNPIDELINDDGQFPDIVHEADRSKE